MCGVVRDCRHCNCEEHRTVQRLVKPKNHVGVIGMMCEGCSG